MTSSNPQLILNLRLRDAATFATYYQGPNAGAVSSLAALAQRGHSHKGAGGQVYLWGAHATGKSHLLQALCHEFSRQEMSSVYIPLKAFNTSDVAILKDLSGLSLVCVDDLDVVIQDRGWEMGLFNLVNVSQQTGHALVLASQQNPARFNGVLPDLTSRLLWGPVFKLQSLDDSGKLVALHAHARQRGISLSDEAARYLLNYYPRDLVSLLEVLDRLDASSLAAKRRLTVPFIKSVLEG